MAIQVSNAFVTLFDSEVKQAYQGQRMLAASHASVATSKVRLLNSLRSGKAQRLSAYHRLM